MKKSSFPWSMSVQETALSQSFSFWRRWTSTGRTPTPCLCSLKRSSHSPATTLHPWWTIPSWSCGARWAGTTWPGTLRSSSLGRTECLSSATAGGSSPATSMETSRSSSVRRTNQPAAQARPVISNTKPGRDLWAFIPSLVSYGGITCALLCLMAVLFVFTTWRHPLKPGVRGLSDEL